jgi:hypothetical protein
MAHVGKLRLHGLTKKQLDKEAFTDQDNALALVECLVLDRLPNELTWEGFMNSGFFYQDRYKQLMNEKPL